ncbi:hypothetical protein EN817_03350 [Mesorhizobium sp. M3A.F.Ca.ET.174.01.1.1]|uniref:hypothetical protein n=1 Tax=unclassified Mesorhizobium TaxID=325217 RepID=UPI0010940FEE|nr:MULTISPECIES: hypothetical protein [unclassified Mesorhizobium]TGS89394.1 hypothetical protein EN818_03350 [Mesorhizobium sp. M3A.F.Ca.ET.175.01.1.1]TGT31167.1 hypothetical protein EN817_03350 [Mesorhizobium sp. M3A.F.Ca.ET.174.01.1.1]
MNLANAHSAETESQPLEASDIVIRGYTSVGQMEGLGKIEIEAREAVIPARRQVAYFVKVEVSTMADYPQSSAILVQYDNLDKLLANLDRLSKINITTDRFKFSEVEYEIDGLKIILFNDNRGKTLFNISTGSISATFSPITRINEFRVLIEKAKKHLEVHRIEY